MGGAPNIWDTILFDNHSHVDVAQNVRARVTQVLVHVSIYLGALLFAFVGATAMSLNIHKNRPVTFRLHGAELPGV